MKRDYKFWLRTPVVVVIIPFALVYDIVSTACSTAYHEGLRYVPRELWLCLRQSYVATVDMAVFTLTGRNRRKERRDREWEELRRSYYP